MTSVLAKKMRLGSADFKRIPSLRPNTFLNQKLALCGRIPFASTEVMHRPRSDFSTIDIVNTYQFRTEKKMLALGVCFPQPCSSAGRRFTTSRSRLNYYKPLRSFYKTNSMKCFVNWIPLNMHVHSNQGQPCLRVIGIGNFSI